MMSFDADVAAPHRKENPNFFGYVPDDNEVRGRTFALMTLISAVHNLSRSVGCALLVLTSWRLVVFFVEEKSL